jgi:hypothetical protein
VSDDPLPGFDFTLCTTDDGNIKNWVNRPRANKIISIWPNSCRSYDDCWLWYIDTKSVPTLEAMADTLLWLADEPYRMIVRGAVKPDAIPVKVDLYVRRYADPDENNNTFVLADRAWMALDIDGIPVAPGLGRGDRVEAAGYYVRDVLLPPEFHRVRGIASVTSSTDAPKCLGTGPLGSDLTRLRLFFLLDRPISDENLRDWTKGYAWRHRLNLDYAVTGTVQPVYTARPTFIDGAEDPAPIDCRVVILGGDGGDRVPLELSPYVDITSHQHSESRKRRRRSGYGWQETIDQELGGIDGYHEVLWRAFGIGISNGADDDEMIAYALAAVARSGDRDRIHHYDRRYMRDRLKAFRKKDARNA